MKRKANPDRPLTDVEIRTLICLATVATGRVPLMAREVARDLWPNAKGWQKISNAGDSGSSRKGGQMGGAAGLILRRLQRRGLVSVSDPERELNGKLRYIPHFSITAAGRKAIGR